MNLPRLALLVVAGCILLSPLRAQSTNAAPWAPDKQFSADQVMTTKEGMTVTSKIYVDNGRVRTETNANGMNIVAIALPADKKIYSILPAQKMIMEMPMNDDMAAKMKASTGSGDAKFETVGPDTVNGVATTKYKMTTGSNPKVFYWWINPSTKAPVKMASDDGSFSILWKNYSTGAQAGSLFTPPAGYQTMQMPAGMQMPGGGSAGGGSQ